MYTVKNDNDRTVITLNRGNYENGTIDWAQAGGREAVNEIRIKKGVVFFGNCADMFRGLVNCEIIETENAATSGIYNLSGMFADCAALKELDLSTFNTATVRDFTGMFNGCAALESLDLSGFTVKPGCFNTDNMFANCAALKKLVLSAGMNVTANMGLHAKGDGFRGWANEDDPNTLITGKDRIAVISGEGTFVRV